MTFPTRSQIEGPFVKPTYRIELESGGVWYPIDNNYVFDISGSIRSTGSTINGLPFGTYTEPTAQVKVDKRGVISTGPTIRAFDSTYWILRRIRISQAFDNCDFVPLFVGVIQEYNVDNTSLVYKIISVLEYVRNVKFYTGATKNRPIASRTTGISIEDPATFGYQAGTINRILWEAGGRPLPQRGIVYDDAEALFWYECEQNIFSPLYTWLNGENLVEELFMLARSSGGQIYQTVEPIIDAGSITGGLAVIKYVQPLTLADTSDYVTFYNYDNSSYTSYSRTLSGVEKASLVTCRYTQRREYALQEIFKDTTPREIRPGETKEYDLETQLPVYTYESITNQNFRISFNHNSRLVDLPFTITRQTATRITVSIENNQAYPVTVNEIKIKGVPLGVEEEGIVTHGSGTPVIELEDNPYIQTYGHARRLTRMVYDFYSSYRPIVTLDGAPYDPDRFLGEIIYCNNDDNVIWNGSAWVNDTGFYRIIGIEHSNTGASMRIMLVPIAGLPDRNDMYIVGETYISTDVRLLSY